MKSFSLFLEEITGQFSYKGMTTSNFDICPSALAAFKDNAKNSDYDSEEDFVDAIKAVDRYLGFEKKVKEKGSADENDVEQMKNLVDRAIEEIDDAGLENHKYHQVHLDAVKDLVDS